MSTNALPSQPDRDRSDTGNTRDTRKPARASSAATREQNGKTSRREAVETLRVVTIQSQTAVEPPHQEIASASNEEKERKSPEEVRETRGRDSHNPSQNRRDRRQNVAEREQLPDRRSTDNSTDKLPRHNQRDSASSMSYDILHQAKPPIPSGRNSRSRSQPATPYERRHGVSQEVKRGNEQSYKTPRKENLPREQSQQPSLQNQLLRQEASSAKQSLYGRSSRRQIEKNSEPSNRAQRKPASREQVRSPVNKSAKDNKQRRSQRKQKDNVENRQSERRYALQASQEYSDTRASTLSPRTRSVVQPARQLGRDSSAKSQPDISPEQVVQQIYKRRHGRRREGFLFLLLLLTMLAMVLWFTLNASLRYLEIQEVSLPNMVGQPIGQVEQQLEQLGLQLERYDEQTREVAAHHVSSQSPAAGSMVRQGRRVVVGVNTPEQAVTLVPLTGLGQDEALAILEDLHLRAAQIDYVANDDVPAGTVLASEPESSSVLATGSTVYLTVSRGPEAAKITMPQLVGLSVSEAERRVRALGVLQVDKVLAGIGNTRVIQHLPVAGEVVLAKAPVTLYYQTSDSNLVWIPDLIGKTMPQVYDDLANAGLTINNHWIEYMQDMNAPDGVVTQSPSAGWALRNSPVALIVNRSSAYAHPSAPSAPVWTGNPTGVGPVSPAPFNPNISIVDVLEGTSLQSPSMQSSHMDSASGSPSLLISPNAPATLPPATLPSTTFVPANPTSSPAAPQISAPLLTQQPPSQQPFQPSGLVAPSMLDNVGNTPNILQPLPPSRLPIPDSNGNLINPLPPTPNPLISAPVVTPAPVTDAALFTPPPPPSVVVSNAPPAHSSTTIPRNIPVNFHPASYSFLQGRSFRYRLVVQDTQGERTLIDRQVQNGETISQLVTVYGSTEQVELRTYIDNEYFQAWNP